MKKIIAALAVLLTFSVCSVVLGDTMKSSDQTGTENSNSAPIIRHKSKASGASGASEVSKDPSFDSHKPDCPLQDREWLFKHNKKLPEWC